MSDWWRSEVLYQVYPRSFADSNGDGVGDLPGIVERLDYLEWLGVDAVWLSPCFPSPNADWGYDVADYRSIHPELGDDDSAGELVERARERGIRVLFDLVPNHTSIEHPWFSDPARRDWYVWAEPKPDGSPPNNWLSVFGGPAWTLDERRGLYYLHNFLPEQPDLNWWNEEVRAEFDDILRFWFERGIAGFRIDVAHAIVKDRALRDNLPATADDHPRTREFGQRQVYSMNRPEVHDVFKRWRRVARAFEPERVLVGETWVLDLEQLARYFGEGDELHLAFNFALVLAELHAGELAEIVDATERATPSFAWPVWTISNHDVVRFPTRWCGESPARVRCALLVLLALRGTPVLYYGDELGMPQTRLARDELKDPVGIRHWPDNPGRDGARTPMPWNAGPGAGFTTPGVAPWLPFGDLHACNVEEQREDPESVLSLTRELLRARRELPELREGPYARLDAPAGAWAWRRGERVVAAVNLGGEDVRLAGVSGRVRLGTDRDRDGERVEGTLELRPSEGVLVVRS